MHAAVNVEPQHEVARASGDGGAGGRSNRVGEHHLKHMAVGGALKTEGKGVAGIRAVEAADARHPLRHEGAARPEADARAQLHCSEITPQIAFRYKLPGRWSGIGADTQHRRYEDLRDVGDG